MRYVAALCRLEPAEADARIAAAIERVRLDEAAAKPVRAYSRGMRQRLAIAEILMKGAAIAILDEPTGGLDPQATREFLDLVRSLKQEGMTILLASHLLELVQSRTFIRRGQSRGPRRNESLSALAARLIETFRRPDARQPESMPPPGLADSPGSGYSRLEYGGHPANVSRVCAAA